MQAESLEQYTSRLREHQIINRTPDPTKNPKSTVIDIKSICDIVCVSETWFKPGMPDNLYQLRSYKILRADRIIHAGRSTIFIKSNIHLNIILKSPTDSDMEYLFNEISAADSKI